MRWIVVRAADGLDRVEGCGELGVGGGRLSGDPEDGARRSVIARLMAASICARRSGSGSAAIARDSARSLIPVTDRDLAAFRRHVPGPELQAGTTIEVVGGDIVSSAPELARVSLNVARVHDDSSAAGGRRLVYGGHTIGIGLAQVTRALPGLVTVLGWHG